MFSFEIICDFYIDIYLIPFFLVHLSQVRRAMLAGIPAENISLSTQELPDDFAEFVNMGVKINAW